MELLRHPDSQSSAVSRIRVSAHRAVNGKLALAFIIEGDLEHFLLPAVSERRRLDGLWRHDCLEAFIAPMEGSPYLELNLSPSGDWAAYRFSSYRQGMEEADIPMPGFARDTFEGRLECRIDLDLCGADFLDPVADWKLGLSAVTEAADGSLDHWALAHPQGRADFHHRDCFVLKLPPAGAA